MQSIAEQSQRYSDLGEDWPFGTRKARRLTHVEDKAQSYRYLHSSEPKVRFVNPAKGPQHEPLTLAQRLERRVERRPTYILDRGYLLLSLPMLLALASTAFLPKATPFTYGLVVIMWGGMVLVDATVRGKSVFDVRLAVAAILIGVGFLVMGVIGVASAL